MQQVKRLIHTVVGISVVTLGLSALVQAHHSTSEYDQTKLVEREGEIVKVFWRNPHVMLHMSAMEDGKQVIWLLEGSSVSSQVRRGLTKDLVNVGDKIRVAGYVSTRRDYDMLARHVLLPSGQELLLRGNGEPYWPEASVIAFKQGVDPEKAAAAKADGIFRVWSWGRLEPGWWFFADTDKFPLTEAALAKHAQWNEYVDNLQLECIAPGMPNTMGNPYPIEFIQIGDNIEMHAEEFDVVRTIHMNAEPDPSIPHSPLGYSVGHWEDDQTLVVSTANINYPYFNRVGVSQSEAVTTVERFNVDDAAGKLNYQLTVSDPSILTEPYTWNGLWVWKPGEVVEMYDCAIDAGPTD
ncbi:DUF6152 family protein [Arenicella sp.]|nr:DUF6152 family protein [Arenicella sp.]